MTTAIYAPAGRAREYAELAVNLYRGCAHGCRYCYAPAALRIDRELFHAWPAPRRGVLEALAREAPKYAGDPREVLLCFSCDPYQPLEATERLTRHALEILSAAKVRTAVLTKAPGLAVARDLELLVRAGTRLGATLVDLTEAFRAEWEPGAPSAETRLAALAAAKAAGLSTWVSVEPVFSPAAALDVLRECARVGVGEVRVGKLNHDPERERLVDWRAFAREAAALCERLNLSYKLKEDLRRWL